LRNAGGFSQRIESRCLNDQLEIKVQRIVTARPMSLMGLGRVKTLCHKGLERGGVTMRAAFVRL